MTAEILRALRDELRAAHRDALEGIENAVLRALDRVAEEAVVWGADDRHNFRTDAAAATVMKSIEHERIAASMLRKLGGGR